VLKIGYFTDFVPHFYLYDNPHCVFKNKLWTFENPSIHYTIDFSQSMNGGVLPEKAIKQIDGATIPIPCDSGIYLFVLHKEKYGGRKVVQFSPDGINWTIICTSLPFYQNTDKKAGIYFNGKLWIFCEAGIWNSPNGVTWTKAADSPLSFINLSDSHFYYNDMIVAFNDKIWMLGDSSKLYNSNDGINWQLVSNSLSPHCSFLSVCKNRLWAFDLSARAVYNSVNGTEWKKYENALHESTSTFIQSSSIISFNNKLYIINMDNPLTDFLLK
jgi:hypothetical protein